MEHFAKTVNGLKPLTILETSSILDASQSFEDASAFYLKTEVCNICAKLRAVTLM